MDEAPSVHYGDSRGHAQRLLLIVRDDEEGGPEPLLDTDQLEPGLRAQLTVECRQWFVEQQELGHLGERARQRHALTLSAGKLVRAAPAIV